MMTHPTIMKTTEWSGLLAACLLVSSIMHRPQGSSPRVEIAIEPEKAKWLEGETIKGSIVFHNPTAKEIKVPSIGLLAPIVKTRKGQAAERFPVRTFHCGTGMNHDITIPSNGQVKELFLINTDPLGEIGGFLMPPGGYTIAFHGIDVKIDHPTPKPAAITVVSNPDFIVGRRIVFIGFGADRITVLRENGEAQNFSIADGRQLSWAELGDITPAYPAMHSAEFSPDGQWIARIIFSPSDKNEFAVQLTHMNDHAETRTLPIKRQHSDSGVPWMRGFDLTSSVLCLASTEGVYEVHVVDGKTNLVSVWPGYSQVSPDGRFGIHLEDALRDRNGAIVEGEWPGTETRRLMGAHGVYGSTLLTSSNWRSYDGATRRTFPDAGDYPVAESPDGTLVVWDTSRCFGWGGGPGRTEVFATAEPTRLWAVADGKFHTVGFCCNGTELASAVVGRGDMDATWISDRVEIFDAVHGTLNRSLVLVSGRPVK